MKIKTKIQLMFSGTVVALMFLMGVIACYSNYQNSKKIICSSMITSAELAANHISEQLADYMNIVQVLGRDEIISGDYSVKEKMEVVNAYVQAYGFTSGNILDKNGVSIKDGTDFSSRNYVANALAGKVNISEVNLSKYTNTYGVSVAAPIYDGENNVKGVIYLRLENNFILDIIGKIKISENGYAYLVDEAGNIIVHPDETISNHVNILEESHTLAALGKRMLSGERGSGQYTRKNKLLFCGYSPVINSNGWSMVIAAPEADFTENLYGVIRMTLIVTILAIIAALLISASVAGYVGKSVNNVKDVLVRIVNGDFSMKLERSQKKDEIAVLENSAAELVDTLSDIVGSSNRILGAMAKYDLTMENMKSYPGEFNSISVSVNTIKNMLNQMIVKVQNTVAGVETGSTQLSEAAAMLSEGTVMQASSIQKVVKDFEDVVEKINHISSNTSIVNGNLMRLDAQIQNSNEEMTQLLEAVKEVEKMSGDIQKIVATIDSIAFQTNLLSLNASVEAARAGESGKGFAVVAGEVRNLATKSIAASKRTADLIEKCLTSIVHAKECADTTFGCLVDIVSGSGEISRTFGDISADTAEQSERSKDIQSEINRISDVIQSNSSTAEETAASSETLSNQASDLDNLVRMFKVKEQNGRN